MFSACKKVLNLLLVNAAPGSLQQWEDWGEVTPTKRRKGNSIRRNMLPVKLHLSTAVLSSNQLLSPENPKLKTHRVPPTISIHFRSLSLTDYWQLRFRYNIAGMTSIPMLCNECARMNCPKEREGLRASVFPNHPFLTSLERFFDQLQLFLEDRGHFFYIHCDQARAIRPRDGCPDNKTY
jgi:hypothetical protein